MKIRVLSDQTINQIAAGEVVENPASVVKELVENALDAGATKICVEIQGGGRQLIRVSDNGCGMSSDDALLCLERHATSKIREVADIQELITMGFRGEAIPSIASISKFSLLTCPHEQEEQSMQGTRVVVDGGRILSSAPAPRARGTTIEVKSLFFNVPVRRKFQRSPHYDTQEIVKLLHTLALGYPFIHFELISDQKSLLKTPSMPSNPSFQEQLGARIENLLGQDFAAALCPLHFQHPPYELKGCIGLPSAHKPNRKSQYLFINQRAVYSPLISTAIREGYGTMLATNRYPLFVLHLTLPGSLLDVNVHPQKKEVRLRQEQVLKEALIKGVHAALHQSGPKFCLPQEEPPELFSLPPFKPVNKEPWEFKANPANELFVCETPLPLLEVKLRETPTSTDPSPTLFAALAPKPKPRVCLTLADYVVLDGCCLEMVQKKPGGLCLMDQKAAYARIYYERLLKRANHSQPLQTLLIPLTLHFSASEAACLKEHLTALNHLGFSIREFGERTFVLDAYPASLASQDIEMCLMGMVQDLLDQQEPRQLQMKQEEKLAWAACRASLPPNKRLSLEEAQGLIDQLLTCESPFHCPLGRSIFLYLSPDELARLFSL